MESWFVLLLILKENEHYYEFIFSDGTIEGTHFTLDETETIISPRLNLPLIVYSPFPKIAEYFRQKYNITRNIHYI